MNVLGPLLPYPGSKFRLREEIKKHLPQDFCGIEEYREPFFGVGGSGIVEYLPKTTRVWINDRDPDIAAIWYCVINHPEGLIQKLQNYKPHPNDFYTFRKLDGRHRRITNAAFCRLVLHFLSFRGNFKSGTPCLWFFYNRWNADKISARIMGWHSLLKTFEQKPKLTSCDFAPLIHGASSKTLIYCDPPYLKGSPVLYTYPLNMTSHRRLAHGLHASNAPWLLSYDKCWQIERLYKKNRKVVVELVSQMNQSRQTEFLIFGDTI